MVVALVLSWSDFCSCSLIGFDLEHFIHLDLYSLFWASSRAAQPAMSSDPWTWVCPGRRGSLLRLVVGRRGWGVLQRHTEGQAETLPQAAAVWKVPYPRHLVSSVDNTLGWRCFAFKVLAWSSGSLFWLHIRIMWAASETWGVQTLP